MRDSYDSDSTQSGGLNISNESRGDSVSDESFEEIFSPKRPRKSYELASREGGELTSLLV